MSSSAADSGKLGRSGHGSKPKSNPQFNQQFNNYAAKKKQQQIEA